MKSFVPNVLCNLHLSSIDNNEDDKLIGVPEAKINPRAWKNKMKIIIAGCRNFNDYKMLSEVCDNLLSKQKEIEIVSGMANGADKLGVKYAENNNIKIKMFPANWDRYGKSAGYKRNNEMAEYADGLIAFWDRKSKGTEHMINLAKRSNLKVRICYFKFIIHKN